MMGRRVDRMLFSIHNNNILYFRVSDRAMGQWDVG